MLSESQEKWSALGEGGSVSSSWTLQEPESRSSNRTVRAESILGAPWQWARLQGYQRILSETYRGDEVALIDGIQDQWEQRLRQSLPQLSASRLFDILLACREIVLNAMIHGCGRREDRSCTLRMWTDSTASWMRVRVTDPGDGYIQAGPGIVGSNGKTRAADAGSPLLDSHFGLFLAKRFATCFTTRSRGAHVQMDFALAIDEEEEQRAL